MVSFIYQTTRVVEEKQRTVLIRTSKSGDLFNALEIYGWNSSLLFFSPSFVISMSYLAGGGKTGLAIRLTRPTLSQFCSVKICQTSFPNFIKFANLLISRLKIMKGPARSCCITNERPREELVSRHDQKSPQIRFLVTSIREKICDVRQYASMRQYYETAICPTGILNSRELNINFILLQKPNSLPSTHLTKFKGDFFAVGTLQSH